MVHSYVLLFGCLEHSDFLRLRHAKRLMCWDGLRIKPLNLHATLHVAMHTAAILNAFRTAGRTMSSKCLVWTAVR